MTMFTRRCSRQLIKWPTEFASSFKIFLMLTLLNSFFVPDIKAQVGTAPVSPPIGGLRVDGFLARQGAAGDWFAGAAPFNGAGTYLFNPNGTSPYPALLNNTLFWKIDPYTVGGVQVGGPETRFTQGSHLNDNPNTWAWDDHSPQSKDDINNAFFFLVQDTISHIDGPHWWALMAGDREATNGTSYLDFEFLQAGVAMNADGTFTSAGPDGGRTVGDIDVTLSYTGGGGIATATVFQWNPVGDGTFIFQQLTPAVGTVFVQSNKTQPTPFPGLSGAFGQNQYTDSLQFVEGAIDITALLGAGISTPCRGLPFTTIFIKTKSSASTTAELKDFIAPFSVNICTDHTPPTITASGTPANGALGCNPSTSAINAALGSATATDACSTPTVTSSDGAVSSSGCSRSQTRIFTATDACGNIATTSRTATWTADVTAPTITTSGTPANGVLGCNPSSAAINGALGTATATDACGTPTLTSTDGAVQSSGCSRSQTRTWTAIDGCGNTATASRTATWTVDVTAPTITATGGSLALGCNPSSATIDVALGSATATDACGTPTVTTSTGAVQSSGCLRSQTRTFTATDACGNTSSTSRTATWTFDQTPPTVTATGTPADGALGCNPTSAAIEAALGTGSATDACGTPTVVASTGGVQSSGCGRSQTRIFTATDACGNTATTSRTATWTEDVTAPTLTATGNTLALGCNPSTASINGALGSASATDACGTPTVTFSDGAIQSSGCARSQTRTWTATDACGNTSSTSRTATWTSDNTAPTITTSGTGLTLCNPSSAAIEAALGTATATDACGTPTLTHTDGAVTGDCVKSQTRTWTATDGCGNTATASRTAQWSSDNTAPTITASGTPANGALGCNPTSAAINAALGSATATDACGTPTVTSTDGAVVSSGCGRSQTRTWTATDVCGNTATTSRTATWTEDLTAPTLTATGNALALGCNPSTAAINGALGTASATDACSTPTVTSSDGAVQSSGCGRSQTRTWTATDACGNTSSTSRTATWTFDITAPTLTATGGALELGCNPSTATINGALGTATATDACGTPTITSTDGAVQSNGCLRSQTRSWTAIDGCGNTATTSRTATWTFDISAPTLTATGGTLALGCNPSTAAINGALGTATATDACGTPTVTSTDGAVQSNGCGRSQTRSWTATDACGNTSSTSRTATWTFDVTAPTLTATGGALELGCNPSTAAINGALGTATATDACSTPTITSSDGAVQSSGCGRSQTRTWIATDACGNTSSTSRTATWTFDITAPTLTATGGALELGCNPSTAAINGALGTATATDACGTPTITSSDGAVQSNGCGRSQTRTWIATDACGNTSSTSRTATWTFDITAPTVTATGGALELGCNPSTATINGALGTATATDACGTPTLTSTDGAIVSTGCGRAQTRTWTATDGCGNTATTSRTATWTADVTAPTLTATGGTLALGCNPSTAAINGALGTATATDACGTPTITSTDGAVQSSGCGRSQTRTWTATDACGNTSSTSRTATWTFDITAPTLTATGGALELGCNPSTAAINGALGTATATDACGTPTVTSTDGAVVTNGCARAQTRTWTATDGCGNVSTTSRTATWTFDVTAPTITATGDNLSLGCNPSTAAINGALGTATATDACGTPTVTSTDGAIVSTGCGRAQTRTWTATDGCGNTATTSRTATWTFDITAPTLTATGGALALGCNPSTAAINGALGTATATDACGTPTITSTDGAVQSSGCSRSQTRSWTATDGCGNTSSTSRTATWTVDLTAPTITTTGNPANGVLGCNPSTSAINAALGTATATDACGTPTLTSSDGAIQSSGCSRSQTRSWTAIDACGNTSTASRTATWTADVTPPTITTSGTPASGVIETCNPSSATINAALGSATATDACGTPTLTFSDGAVVTNGCNFSQTRTWTATDACGNTSTASRTATWKCCSICTYTQGYYGNVGGKSCSGESDPAVNEFTTTGLINRSIANWGGTITIGCAGHSVTISTGQASCVIDKLPGGGPSGSLPAGNYTICNFPDLKNGRINNALLAQTITLGLNMGINPPTLSNFGLQPSQWLVTVENVECGSSAIKSCKFNCTPNLAVPGTYIWTVSYTPYHVSGCRISQAIYNAISPKTVAGLYALANSALCGNALPAGISYSDITSAVDCINNAFDGCRSFVAWASGDVAPTAASFCSLPSSTTPCPAVTTATPANESFASTDYLKVTAYPNPFKSTVKFTLQSTVSGQAQLEVYNTMGQRVSIVYNGYLQANRGQVVEYKAPRLGSNLIYILRVGGKQVTGKLLRLE